MRGHRWIELLLVLWVIPLLLAAGPSRKLAAPTTPISLSVRWALSLFNRLPIIVGQREQDFDTGAHLSGICFFVTIVLLRLQTFYPKITLPAKSTNCVTSCHSTSRSGGNRFSNRV